jgi:hypothetical protein
MNEISSGFTLKSARSHGNKGGRLCLTKPFRRAPRPTRPRQPIGRPQAALWSLPDAITDALKVGTLAGIALATGLSLLPILTGDAKERNEQRFVRPNADESADNIKWGVMSALTLLPFLNPMAWVFGALDDPDSAYLYWSFAALYTLPYVRSGFELDGLAVAALLLGIVHVQVERIAQTEPAELELPEVVRTALRALPRAVTSLGRYSSGIGEEVSERLRRSEEARKGRPDRKYLEEKSQEARAELDEFDRKRRERERDKQRRK